MRSKRPDSTIVEHVSPKQAARALGVSESTVKRWCDRGTLPTVRTAGGHRRIPIADLLTWARTAGQELVHPDLLGLPSGIHRGDGLGEGRQRLLAALAEGDEAAARDVLLGLYVSGHALVDLFDTALAQTFVAIGSAWERGELEVYQERRACGIAARVLAELRRLQPVPSPDAPRALGGTPSGDPYALANGAVELALREAGWNATSLGSGLPGQTIAAAIERERPTLVWLSVSHIESEESFFAEYQTLATAAERVGAAIAVGGAALGPEVRSRMRFSFYGDTLAHLVAFGQTLRSASEAGSGSATG